MDLGDESLQALGRVLGDHPTPISEVFKWFLESQPKVIEFAELATADPTDIDPEPEVFAKLGVTAKQVEKYRGR